MTGPDPWHLAEYHARELAKAMAAWPDMMRFQITIVPHAADQHLLWVQMPNPEGEVGRVNELIEAHRSALERFAAVADPDDASEEERQAADHAETAAFDELLKITCETTAARERKADYIVEHLGKNRFSLELDVDQLETLLGSLI
ncbi:hypothetical protein [Rhizobium rhizogenes]|jgi:hypothetical protein|uniref:hypothetical protein n=1 Tax=Rhizobium rhizogenes TaxID=359 RepID=UPI0015722AA4|nr:hypothetical protein [Rhizobium rhizogenes]NTI29262.1 hypothetical protein [Rhizobium rhizogenes]